MKRALVVTTIGIPKLLSVYRACDSETKFYIVADEKTPLQTYEFCAGIENCEIYSPDRQRELGYRCSELIGWTTVARRNIGTLEAVKEGADLVVFLDDDNLCLTLDYFDCFEMALNSPFSGCSVYGFGGWFDPGRLTSGSVEYATQRGFPHEHQDDLWGVKPVVNAKVGVAQGLILGDPDTSAVERMALAPEITIVSELARAGCVLDSHAWAPLNSQNIAFVRELAPCFLMVPQFKRYDDIFASLVAQRIMRETGHVVHFGQPFVWQQRNAHDLNKDLEAELWGMQHVLEFTDYLDRLKFPENWSTVEQLRSIWLGCAALPWMPPNVADLGIAWLEDIESVL